MSDATHRSRSRAAVRDALSLSVAVAGSTFAWRWLESLSLKSTGELSIAVLGVCSFAITFALIHSALSRLLLPRSRRKEYAALKNEVAPAAASWVHAAQPSRMELPSEAIVRLMILAIESRIHEADVQGSPLRQALIASAAQGNRRQVTLVSGAQLKADADEDARRHETKRSALQMLKQRPGASAYVG